MGLGLRAWGLGRFFLTLPTQWNMDNAECYMGNVRPGPVVQWIECQIPVLKVVGSTPAGVTQQKSAHRALFCCVCGGMENPRLGSNRGPAVGRTEFTKPPKAR